MDQAQYTLPGVMNFLRTEWQRKEQTRIEWEIERADMRARITRLEAEKLELQRERDRARRHLDIVYGQHPPPRLNGAARGAEAGSAPDVAASSGAAAHMNKKAARRARGRAGRAGKTAAPNKAAPASAAADESADGPADGPAGANGAAQAPQGADEAHATASNGGSSRDDSDAEGLGSDSDAYDSHDEGVEQSLRASDALARTVAESQEYLKQCVADIRHVLRQSSSMRSEADVLVAPQLGLASQSMRTLANFGGAALTVAALPKDRVAAGTVDGDLLMWSRGATEPRKFGENAEPISCIRHSAATDRILVAVGATVQVFDTADVPQLVATHDFGAEGHGGGDGSPVTRVAVAPNGNLVAVVQASGAASVWALQNGTELVKMSDAAGSVRVCDFVEVPNGDLHLVLARASDPADPDGPDGNLLLADPLTGQLLKKIVFTFNAGISAILLTPEAIVLGTDSGDLRVLGLARGETLAEVTAAHRGEVTSLALARGQLLSTSVDGRASLWSLPGLLWTGRLFSHDSGYGALCSSVCDGTAVVGGGDGIIRVYGA